MQYLTTEQKINKLKCSLSSVIDFNRLAGNVSQSGTYSDARLQLQQNLNEEELAEVLDSCTQEEYLFELCDLFVVSSFWVYMKCNNDLTVLHNIIEDEAQGISTSFGLALIENAISEGSPTGVFHSVLAHGREFGSYFFSALDEVLECNMSKYPQVGEVDPVAECDRLNAEGRYTGVTYRITECGRYVFTADSGKVVKPSTSRKPSPAKLNIIREV